MSEYILRTESVGKNYGAIVALENVNFNVKPGEVVGIVGDNGAGKSTFIKILSGAHKASKGYVYMGDELVDFDSPRDAIDRGIETVYQDLSLAPHLDVVGNIFLGREIEKKGLGGKLFHTLDRKEMTKRTEEVLKRLKIRVKSVKQPVGTLSGGQRQAVAIGKAIAWGSKVVILDEPTNNLGVEESEKVLSMIRDIAKQGISVILISHTLPYVMEVCDRIFVFHLGKSIAVLDRKETNIDELVSWITGSKTMEVHLEDEGEEEAK
ncbi:MAG: sugar ABC transporter ATP-binding protein [Lachnospiraceae bacterium]|nr:sugar ABC transporter ATP-binding protein [Lachnospiraceae bacterium]MBQ9562599.1 sugar ABC transporter ATP-binding protein [Lachnospiraceae bacterium]MBR0152972.1 sugar ABC transporter ATP-binding protein [Lachnospiraceae bacterium]